MTRRDLGWFVGVVAMTGVSAAAPAGQEAELWLSARNANEAATTGKTGPLAGLARRLSDALLTPKASVGPLSGDSTQRLTAAAQLEYAPDTAAVDGVMDALAREFPGKLALCASQGGYTKSVKVSRTGLEAAGVAVGLPTGAADVVATVEVTLGDRVVRVSNGTAGAAMAALLQKRGAQTQPTAIELWPALEAVPVRLTLTTTDQKKITLPVELDGDATKYKVADNAVWIFPDGATVLVEPARPFHALLLDQVVRGGVARLERVSVGAIKPVWRGAVKRPEARRFDVHVVGANDRWFSRTGIELSSTVSVQRDVDACDLSLRFDPEAQEVSLPALSLAAWKSVTGLTLVDPAASVVTYGFLEGPAPESHVGGGTAATFDDAFTRPGRCKQVCAETETGLDKRHDVEMKKWSALPADNNRPPAPTRIKFSQADCESSCKVSTAYLECLETAKTDVTVTECEARRPTP